jgi:hypothetical protein
VSSLSQLWLLGSASDGATQTIESGWQTFPALWGTAAPALFIYYNPHGYDASGGYVTNSANLGFVLSPGSGWIVGGAMPQPYTPYARDDDLVEEWAEPKPRSRMRTVLVVLLLIAIGFLAGVYVGRAGGAANAPERGGGAAATSTARPGATGGGRVGGGTFRAF